MVGGFSAENLGWVLFIAGHSARGAIKKANRFLHGLDIFSDLMVGAARFELATPGSQNQCSTRLSYTPKVAKRH